MKGWRSAARDRLDHRGTRWLLGALASVHVMVTLREPCWVRWRNGIWIYHYRGDAFADQALLDPKELSGLMDRVRNNALYEYTPRPGDIVLDVGAGFGATTLLYSHLVGPRGRVVALEAHPATYAELDRLCRMNGLDNVTLLHVAASASAGDVVITDSAEPDANTIVGTDRQGAIVSAQALDDVAQDLKLAEINFLSMNIEGAEKLVIEGMTSLIERTQHVCISCHDFVADSGGPETMRTKAVVQEFLLKHGFRVITREDEQNPWTRDYVYGANPSLA